MSQGDNWKDFGWAYRVKGNWYKPRYYTIKAKSGHTLSEMESYRCIVNNTEAMVLTSRKEIMEPPNEGAQSTDPFTFLHLQQGTLNQVWDSFTKRYAASGKRRKK